MAALHSGEFDWKYTACCLCSSSHLHSKANSQGWGGGAGVQRDGEEEKVIKYPELEDRECRSLPPSLRTQAAGDEERNKDTATRWRGGGGSGAPPGEGD